MGSGARSRRSRDCESCGVNFYPWRGAASRGGGKYCSLRCARKVRVGPLSPSWKGGVHINPNGYIVVRNSVSLSVDRQHRLIAEMALGKPLGVKYPVHHHDENRENNSNANLVICESRGYHALIHARMRVLKAGGDPNLDKICTHCKSVMPKTSFNRDRSRCDGYDAKCMPCRREIHRTRVMVKEMIKERS